MRSFLTGATYPFRGLAFLGRRRALWSWLAAPLLIHALLLALALTLFLLFRKDLVAALLPEAWTGWVRGLAGFALQVAAALLALLGSVLLGNVLAAPFLDALAGRVLMAAGEAAPPPQSAAASLGRASANEALQLLILGAVQSGLLALWVTPLGFLHPPLSVAASLLFIAQETLDPALDARGLSPVDRLRWIARHAGSVAGFGAALLPFLAVPLVGPLLLPCAVAGAALLVHDLDSPGSNK